MRSTIHGAQKSVVIMGDINHADRKQEEKEKNGTLFCRQQTGGHHHFISSYIYTILMLHLHFIFINIYIV